MKSTEHQKWYKFHQHRQFIILLTVQCTGASPWPHDVPGYMVVTYTGVLCVCSYYKYSETEAHIASGYPRLKADVWMGPVCGGQPYAPK